MDYYHIWCNLKDNRQDLEFCRAINDYLNEFRKMNTIESFKITRRKLGFGPPEIGEFHIIIKIKNMSKLEHTWEHVAKKEEPLLSLHTAVYSKVTDFRSALYRDFPDNFGEKNN